MVLQRKYGNSTVRRGAMSHVRGTLPEKRRTCVRIVPATNDQFYFITNVPLIL